MHYYTPGARVARPIRQALIDILIMEFVHNDVTSTRWLRYLGYQCTGTYGEIVLIDHISLVKKDTDQ